VDRDQHLRDALGERLVLVVGAEVTFAMLVDFVTGNPPALVATVAFGAVLALGLSWQARRSPV
jgi:hypothetical protein